MEIDLDEIEAGQPNWLSVIAKQKAEAKREAHKKKLMADMKKRYQERRKRERKKGEGPHRKKSS
jgi:hypothetical protein